MTANEATAARLDEIAPGGMKQVMVGGVEVLLARVGDEVMALGARCAHFGAPLVEGVLHGHRLTCPWHHAVYDIRSGVQLEPPGCDGLQRYPARVVDGTVRVAVPPGASGRAEPAFATAAPAGDRRLFVIVGAGAAGGSAAETLRASGFRGRIVLVGRENEPPYDRTLLSKEVLRGADLPAPLSLRPAAFHARHGIELRLGRAVAGIEPDSRTVIFADGERLAWDGCLLATGGEPRRLDVPGTDLPGVRLLRSHADAAEILRRAERARRVVIVGGSFIALECAAALTRRGLDVVVVAPDKLPFVRLFGEAVGHALAAVHAAAGTRFRWGRHVVRFEGGATVEAAVTDAGERLPADLVIVGIGVRPATDPFRNLGLQEDGGILVDSRLHVGNGLYAAGDIAAFPLPDGRRTRIEHWRVACEHGRIAALNLLGHDVAYEGVPFFWSAQHWALYHVGHAERFDEAILDGRPGEGPFIAYYREGPRITAALGVQRNAEMAAFQELLRLGRAPDPETVRRGFDAREALSRLRDAA